MIQNKALRIATGCQQKGGASHLRAETGVLPLRAHLELRCQQFYTRLVNPYTPVTSPLRTTLQASYHRTLRSLRVRGDDPNAPHLIFGGVLEEGGYSLARRLFRGRIIEETIRSQAPNKVLMARPLPIDLTEQLLPRSYCGSSRSFSPTVTPQAGPMTPPVPIAAPPTIRWPTSSAVPLIPRIWPRGICGRHPSRSPNSWQGSNSSATCPHCRSISTPFLHNLLSRFWPPSPWSQAGPHHPHLTRCPGVISPYSNQQQPKSIQRNYVFHKWRIEGKCAICC